MSTLEVLEYETIDIQKINKVVNNNEKAKKIFKELEVFAQDNENRFLVYSRSGQLKPQNYVGIIQTKSGFSLEILPKIAQDVNNNKSKDILIKMLKTLKDSPFQYFQMANLKTKKMPLLEIFISMFLSEMENLIRKGVKSNYIKQEQNQTFLKGKLRYKEQISKNFIHKERFFVEYDEYLPNRIENRILKTALLKLFKLSKLSKNQQRIRVNMFIFEGVDTISTDIEAAFNMINLDRTLKYYDLPLKWAKIFLLEEAFTPFRGKTVSFALLFDMNKLFESYVGYFFKKRYENIRLQDKRHYMFDKPKSFSLIPDIVINEGKIILDTKWKVVSKMQDVSQADLYQIFAYAAKYQNCKQVFLIYPYIDQEFFQTMTMQFNEKSRDVQFMTMFFDLEKDVAWFGI